MGQVIHLKSFNHTNIEPDPTFDISRLTAIRQKLDCATNTIGNCVKVCAATVDMLPDGATKAYFQEQMEGLRRQLLMASLEVARLHLLDRQFGAREPA